MGIKKVEKLVLPHLLRHGYGRLRFVPLLKDRVTGHVQFITFLCFLAHLVHRAVLNSA